MHNFAIAGVIVFILVVALYIFRARSKVLPKDPVVSQPPSAPYVSSPDIVRTPEEQAALEKTAGK
jgi:hypothetical protein